MNIEKMIERYHSELYKSVIPFWENHCVDHENGGYFTSLDQKGVVYDTMKYMWMQWRIVYTFATIGRLHNKTKWIDIASRGYDFLTRHGKSDDGSYYFALNRQGVPAMAPASIYTDCFAAMGAAAMFAATGKSECKIEAEASMRNYLRRIPDPKGRWNKALSGMPQRKSFGHYMMLTNLGSVMRENLNPDEFDVDARETLNIVTSDFWNKEIGIFFENINPDGNFDLESCEGRTLNPGHALESLWFLLQLLEKELSDGEIVNICDYIYKTYQFGLDREYGGIYYFMDALGKPHIELQWDMKLWWVHCEALIAAVYAWNFTGEERFARMFKELDDWTWSHFPDSENGEWFGYLNRRGEPTHTLKGGKWKTCYHLPRCLMECLKQLELIKAKKDAGKY
ncbi:MAG: AGE family epimerase/isomerase [Lentisphaerae bacterium]|nr:AGE family epimerase/isomerase [Lentisphaerota bacterium]MCP4101620.1 AGE family epimerase/isomerase [Lentisphaerota bacterium]